ncbi:nucleotidyltransferase domain-containing protein [Azospirillum sp. ST 5-10]|uniref:nucleotidyltransferase domain-containing protein n=1 Tax=unclassified Azospirillum TaxID=2630922 RepID=UPI003F49BB06
MPTSRASDLSEAEQCALAAFAKRMRHRYVDRLRGLAVYGSRARRDHRRDNDLDVAVILASPIEDVVGEALAMADDAYDVLLDHGLLIQPLSIEEGSLEEPDAHPMPHLTRRIAAEGLRL